MPSLPLLILAMVLLISPRLALGEGPPDKAMEGRSNPHAGLECAHCHKTVPEKGKTPWKEVLAGLTKGPEEICRECHDPADVNHHPVRIKTDRKLPTGLPLSHSGEVVCSTCHDVHLRTSRVALLRGFDTGRYAVRMDMCLDCHGEKFSILNPHSVDAGSGKCSTCHVSKPGSGDTSATVALKDRIVKVCNFCHAVAEKSHPQNVNPLLVLPANLPRGKGGQADCGTCHDPHGTESTLHFLRKSYVEFLEAGRYINPHVAGDYASCRGCHMEVSTKKEDMRKNRRYRGDDLLICLSCHGSMDSCHPILVKLGPGMRPGTDLPLSGDGKITCLTCHNPMPASGKGLEIRGRKTGEGETVNALCYKCHDKLDLSGRNPHSTMDDRDTCKFCHDTMTDPTNEEASRVSFISNTRLICLRCHAQEGHPMGVNHMVRPKMAVPEYFRLDGKGRITCTTCHNPHIDVRTKEGTGRKKRFVVEDEGQPICSGCHRR